MEGTDKVLQTGELLLRSFLFRFWHGPILLIGVGVVIRRVGVMCVRID